VVKLAHPKSAAPSSQHLPNTLVCDATRALWFDRWVSYPRAERILSRLDDLMSLPARVRMQNVLIHGNSGAGKSMIIESCCDRSNVEFACGTASSAAKPYTLLNINFADSCSVFLRDCKRRSDQHASHRGSPGCQAI
jgi:Bacterial TniB protein